MNEQRPSKESDIPINEVICELKHDLRSADAGPWEIYTSNSYRRVGLAGTYKAVVYPVVHKDGQPDIAGFHNLHAMVESFNAAPRLIAEIERLQIALRGIQSCSTCEACRGAATLALGGDRASVFANAATDSETFVVTAGQVTHYEQPAPEPPPALRPDGMPEPSLDVLKRVAARMRETAPDTAYLAQWAADQIEEHDQSFDLRWKADMRAIKRWQEANPGNDLTWPDHADLCVWLLEQLDARAAQPPSPIAAAVEQAERDGRPFAAHLLRAAQPPGDGND